MSYNTSLGIPDPYSKPLGKPQKRVTYDFLNPNEVLAMAKTLTPEEGAEVAQYVIDRYGHKTPPPGSSPEKQAAVLGSRIMDTMASLAEEKMNTGTSISDLIEKHKNTRYLGSVFSLQDQAASFMQSITDPAKVIEFGIGIYEKDPAAIAKFILEWQWTAHNTDTSQPNPAPASAYQGHYCPYAQPFPGSAKQGVAS